MAKKNNKIDNSNIENEKGIVVYPLDELMGDRFGRYAKYIIQDRALPDVRDGLKPVQRRILYAMNELNLTHDKPYKKSARVVGEVIGKYHPHGDTSIYEAMVRMSQPWKLNMPLIEMQGNNGSIDGDSAAAMRYTEARLEKITKLMLEDLEKKTVLFAPNFDDSEKEPTVLPSYFPNILVNGSTGIAAGYATNMAPHNLGELIDATIALIKTPNTRIDTILELIKGPDFPTGAIVQGRDGIRDAFLTGKGKVIINAKWHEENGNIIIDEIPYEVVKQDLVRKIGDVIDANPGLGIQEVRDETDRNGLRIAIDLSDKANVETVRRFLFKTTPLSVSYNYNNVVIVDKQPQQLGIISILKAYIEHYKEVFLRCVKFDLNKSDKKLEIANGLIKAMSILDEVIIIIRKSNNRSDAIANLVKAFEFSENQAQAIVDMRLHRLTSTDIVKLNEEKASLELAIKNYKQIISDEVVLNNTIITRLKEVKKQFAIPRRSLVENLIENLDVKQEEIIIEKEFNLWISKDGYLKAIDNAILNKNDISTFGKKPNDMWINQVVVSNLSYVLLITNKGTYYSFPLYKLPMSKWRDMGVHINSIATMDANETLVASFIIPNYMDATQHIMLATKNGLIKRTPITDFETKIFTKSFRIMKLIGSDEVVSADLITSNTKTACVITQKGYAVRYNLEDIPVQGPNSKGVKSANLTNDHIVSVRALEFENNLLVVTERNQIKKLDANRIPIYIRPKKGVRIIQERKRGTEHINFAFATNGNDVIQYLTNEDEIMEVNVSKYRVIDFDSTNSDSGVKDIAYASLVKNFAITLNDIPVESMSTNGEGTEYVSRKEMREKQEQNRHKVTDKVFVSKEKKAESAAKVDALSTGLSSLLDDISSIMDNVSGNENKKKKLEKAEQEDKIQLNFDDLFNE